jgi:hypothetical protein
MSRFLELWANEPAVVVGVVVALLGLAGAFGLALNEEQTAAIVGVVTAVGAIVSSLVVRSRVSPTK